MEVELTGSEIDPLRPVAIPVLGILDTKHASQRAAAIAEAIGFSAHDCHEISLVVTELASNLLKHAKGGVIKIGAPHDDRRKGIRIESEDEGPGIVDIERALTDGYSTAGSLGEGLGAVNRMMDETEFIPRTPRGLHVICHRWIRPAPELFSTSTLQIGAATRAYRGWVENGDAFVIRQWKGHALVGVIDGLGHGQFAQRASCTARQYVESHFDQPLVNLFRGVGRVCRPTRGVVMALVRFDLDQQSMAIASVGNIETRVISNRPLNLVVRRGVVGLNAPQPVISERGWESTDILILHSDGLKTHWDWADFRDLTNEPASVIAQRLLSKLGKFEDDATVLVVKDTRA